MSQYPTNSYFSQGQVKHEGGRSSSPTTITAMGPAPKLHPGGFATGATHVYHAPSTTTFYIFQQPGKYAINVNGHRGGFENPARQQQTFHEGMGPTNAGNPPAKYYPE